MQNHFRLQSLPSVGFAVIVVTMLGIATFAYATGTVITACAERNGTIYLIGTGFRQSKCEKGDSPISWNTQGQQGSKGDIGPVGPMGATGTPGAAGLQGPKGDAGSPGKDGTPSQNLHLLDANGRDLGIYLGRISISGAYEAYLPTLGISVFITTNDENETVAIAPAGAGGGAQYASSDCSGNGYTSTGGSLNELSEIDVLPSGTHYYTPLAAARVTVNIASRAGNGGTCTTFTPIPETVILLKEITLPFTVPIPWPLHIASL